MAIYIDDQCYLCHMRRNLELARQLGDEASATAFAKDLMRLYLDAPENVSSPWLGPRTNALFSKHYGLDPDRFREEKRASNAFVRSRLEMIRSRIAKAEDPLLAAVQFSILGNYIDFSALQGEVSFETLDKMLDNAQRMDLDMACYDALRRDLSAGKKLLYLTDNAGEIGFDMLLAEQMQAQYPQLQITFCVRGGPAMNDATREDALFFDLPFSVIDNGNTIAGTELRCLGQAARKAFEEADVIFSKGQGNAETLLGCGYNVYYAFLVKCVRFMQLFGKEKLTPMLVKER